MNTDIIVTVFVIIILAYFVFQETSDSIKPELKTQKKLTGNSDLFFLPKKVRIYTPEKEYLCFDENTRYFYLGENKDTAGIFTLEYIKRPEFEKMGYSEIKKLDNPETAFFTNKISIKVEDGYYLGLSYSTFPKEEYEISATSNILSNSCILKTKRDVDGFYSCKFFNIFHLNISDGILFCNKTNIKPFKFKCKELKRSEASE
jgi:hypothetical protein